MSEWNRVDAEAFQQRIHDLAGRLDDIAATLEESPETIESRFVGALGLEIIASSSEFSRFKLWSSVITCSEIGERVAGCGTVFATGGCTIKIARTIREASDGLRGLAREISSQDCGNLLRAR